ncbi:MAG TPA: NAD-dependent protein deacylase [Firmicutes bacterium]|nr:NAD-dependent protein deacylase [Bacillota bacterium]
MTQVEQLQQLVNQSRRIVAFTGAGCSTESGVPDFRSVDGLYRQTWNYPPEEILSHEFFLQHPEEFYRFYRAKMLFPHARPNPAHRKLAQLEAAGRLSAVITQNIDGLHQQAGSKRVLELHGSVHRNFCMDCGKPYPLDAILETEGLPRCSCGGLIKPDVVLYGECLDDRVLEQSIRELERADLLLVGGTSLSVYPAAGLLRYFRGSHLVLINKTPTDRDRDAQLVIPQPIGQVLEQLEVLPL